MIWVDSVIKCWPWRNCRNIYLYTNIRIYICRKNENRGFDFMRDFEIQFWIFFKLSCRQDKKLKIGTKNRNWIKKLLTKIENYIYTYIRISYRVIKIKKGILFFLPRLRFSKEKIQNWILKSLHKIKILVLILMTLKNPDISL